MINYNNNNKHEFWKCRFYSAFSYELQTEYWWKLNYSENHLGMKYSRDRRFCDAFNKTNTDIINS